MTPPLGGSPLEEQIAGSGLCQGQGGPGAHNGPSVNEAHLLISPIVGGLSPVNRRAVMRPLA